MNLYRILPIKWILLLSVLSKHIIEIVLRIPGMRHFYLQNQLKKIGQYKVRPKVDSDPNRLSLGCVEINKNCNLDCIMCNTSLSTRKQMNMDMALFEKSIREAKALGQPYVNLHTIGDPLLNAKLEDYFKIMRKHGIKANFLTNALLLSKRLQLLCDNRDVIAIMRFSVDGASKEIYEKIRIHGNFDNLLENLNAFREANRSKRYFRHVRIQSIVSQDNQHELAHFLKFFSKYTEMQNIDLNLLNGLSLDNTYFLSKSVFKKHIRRQNPCEQLFSSVVHVLNDGSVTTCCRDYNGDLIYGDFKKEDTKALINNEKIQEFRKQQLEDRIPKNSLCAECFHNDPKLDRYFSLFVSNLVSRHAHQWDTEKMQARFNHFFDAFQEKIPSQEECLKIFLN